MTVRRLPERPRVLIFDMDGTLYTNEAYFNWQETSQVARLANWIGLSERAAQEKVDAAREARRVSGLPKTSLARIFLSFGVDMPTIIRWRIEEIRPSEWLTTDARLDATLDQLSTRYRLALLTNNPRSIGRDALVALGVHARFDAVVGLDDTNESKPAREPFLQVCRNLGVEPSACVSIGDRPDVDIEPALALGMGAILVQGVEDVYLLPATLPV